MNVNAAAAAKEKKTRFVEHLKNAFKGTLISMIFTVAVMLLFALIIKETGMADAVIRPISQVIKILGIIAASYFAVKGMIEKQWIAGGIAGVMYTLLSYLILSISYGMFGAVALLFSDLLMGLLIGVIFAIITANFLSGRRAKKAKMTKRRLTAK